MIERTFDASFINEVANDPSVRPYIADETGTIDLSPQVEDRDNVCLIGKHGAFVCFKYFEGYYEVHTMVLQRGRGAWAREFAIAGAHYMFTRTPCLEILTRVPERHKAARQLTEFMDFILRPIDSECKWNGMQMQCDVYSLTIQDWSLRPNELLVERGVEFHRWLNEQVKEGVPHADSYWHNKIVGTCLEMIDGGQVAKAVAWYNRCALAARHETIELLSMEPLRVRFDAGVLTKIDGEIQFELGSAHP